MSGGSAMSPVYGASGPRASHHASHRARIRVRCSKTLLKLAINGMHCSNIRSP